MGGNLETDINPGEKPTITHSLSLANWHQRYQQQAKWTQSIREYLFARINQPTSLHLLEVGSGTGALLEQIDHENDRTLIGIDIDRSALLFSKQLQQKFHLAQADGCRLPFPKQIFDISICHFLLLWVQNPRQILLEMRRVTKNGGCVIAMAEPDYTARIDYPPPLDDLGCLQTQSLNQQGADIQMGRKLGWLFQESGLQDIETGILGAQWKATSNDLVDETEWETLYSDLGDSLSGFDLSQIRDIEKEANKNGSRVLFVPTFYASGIVV